MRAVTGTLDTAENALNRSPIARLTIRDVRLRFARFAIYANPVGDGDDTTYSDQVTTPNGNILRAISRGDTIFTSSVAPGLAENWTNWTNQNIPTEVSAYASLGTNYFATWISNVGLYAGSSVYMFYLDASTSHLSWRSSSDNGNTFGVATDTGLTLFAPCVIAPVSQNEVYVSQQVGVSTGSAVKITRCFYNGSAWSSSDMPWHIFGDPTAGSDWINFGTLHLDAEQLASGTTVIVYGNRFYGLAYATSYLNGIWSNPQLLLADDYTKFYPSHLSIIQNRLWLTGKVSRANYPLYSPVFDAYLYSDDGVNWTALARDAWLTANTLSGKIHLSGSYAYYSGSATVLQAPSSYFIDPAGDPASMKMVVGANTGAGEYDDFIEADGGYSAAGVAPQISIDLANATDAYIPGNTAPVDHSGLVKGGSDIVLQAGYKTSVGDEFATLFQGNIDIVDTIVADGQRDAKLTIRDACFKKLVSYVSPFAWDLASQVKSFDPMLALNNFAIQLGNWTSLGVNIATSNPGFEINTNGWADYSTGAATGTRTRITSDFNSGIASYQLIKTGGANADRWGTYFSINASSGSTYIVTLYVNCIAISGGNISYSLKTQGNYGLLGAPAGDAVSGSDITSFWIPMTLTFVCQSSCAVGVYFFLDNCTAGTIEIDDLSVQDSAPSYISCNDQDNEEILFSTQPPTLDFDVRGQFEDVTTTPCYSFGMGLVGLAQDPNNLIVFELARVNSVYYVFLLKRRSGAWTLLASASFGWTTNALFDLRLVHKGGHFWGYAKAAWPNSNWGSPLIDYTWQATDGPLCSTSDGKGQVGIRCAIHPLRFHAYATDAVSTLVCLRTSNDLDFAKFPSHGLVIWEGEQITYNTKTATDVVPAAPAFVSAAPTVWQGCGANPTGLPCVLGQVPYSWDHHVNVTIAGAVDHQYDASGPNGAYGIIFPKGGAPGAAWNITDFRALAGGVVRTDGDSGHANTNGQTSGIPSSHVLDGPNVAAVITPCLSGCTRGANGTQAIIHTDNSMVYQFADDQVQIHEFHFYDAAIDYSHESLLQKLSAMAGVTSCVFDSREFTQSYSIIASPSAWSYQEIKDWNNNSFNLNDWEVIFDCSALGDGEGIGAMWQGTWGVFLQYTIAGGFTASLASTPPSNPYEIFTLPTQLQPTAGVSLHLRFVVSNGFGTLYINGCSVATFHQPGPSGGAATIQLVGKGAGLNITNLHIPDLLSWREFAVVNSGEDMKANITRIIGDRPIYMTSLSGATLKFSSYDKRASLGTFTDTIYSDETAPDDSQMFTFYRVEAADIIETIDPNLSMTYGFLHQHLAMQEASTPEAAIMVARLIRRSQEVAGGRTEQMPGNLTFEIEDKFVANFTASGTGLAINQTLIVNDLSYTLKRAEFSMQVGARKFIS